MWNHVTSCDIIFFGCFNQVCMVCAHVFVSNCSPIFPMGSSTPSRGQASAGRSGDSGGGGEANQCITMIWWWWNWIFGISIYWCWYHTNKIYIPSSLHQQNNWYDDGNEYWPYMNVSWNYSILQLYITIWRFPEMGGHPPNHPFERIFHEINNPFWGSSIYGNPYIWLVLWNIFLSIYWESSSQVTNMFQRGWNKQPDCFLCVLWMVNS